LGLDIIQLESATKRFLTYDPRQAGFYFDVNSNTAAPNSPLNINYRVLNSIANNPEAFVFDLDDCLIMSERAHKKAWNAALKLWAADIHRQGGQTLQPSTVAKLCRTVDYCLAKDQTHGLLSLLCRICERHGFLIEQGEHGTPERALESSLARFRAEALCDSLTRREITFAPGSTDLLSHAFLDGKKLGLFTNSPQVIVDKLLLKLDELNPEVGINELLPTCARVYGDTTAHRKPFPLGWLEVAKQLNCRPDQVMIFDNSLVNCDAASELSRYCTHSDVVAAMKDRTASQNFAAVVGITNSDHCNLSLWRNWSANPGKTVRVTVDALSRIIVA
jgi:beta-phosphoglucomutase-like phosphatase (HAD superfamily)